MFVDFVGEPVPTHGFTSTRTFNKVINCPVCNIINQLPTKLHPHQQQNFYNPQTMAPLNIRMIPQLTVPTKLLSNKPAKF